MAEPGAGFSSPARRLSSRAGQRLSSPNDVGLSSPGLVVDLFCGGGGASVGYWLAGWDVIGIDLVPQEHYPFPFVQADATTLDMSTLAATARAAFVVGDPSRDENPPAMVFHASPPCQRYSTITPKGHTHPDLVPVMRARLLEAVSSRAAAAFVIENVPGAPMRSPVQLCGGAFGLGVRRHRLFESSVPLWSTPCRHGDPVACVVGGVRRPSSTALRHGRRGTRGHGRGLDAMAGLGSIDPARLHPPSGRAADRGPGGFVTHVGESSRRRAAAALSLRCRAAAGFRHRKVATALQPAVPPGRLSREGTRGARLALSP
jgi:hypothetical protein